MMFWWIYIFFRNRMKFVEFLLFWFSFGAGRRGGWKVKVSKLEFLKKQTNNLNSELEPSRDLKGFSSKVSLGFPSSPTIAAPPARLMPGKKPKARRYSAKQQMTYLNHLLKWLVKTHLTLTTVTKTPHVFCKISQQSLSRIFRPHQIYNAIRWRYLNDTQWFPLLPRDLGVSPLGFSGYLRQRGDFGESWKTRTENFIWKFKKYIRVSEVRCEFMNYSKSTKKITLNKHSYLCFLFINQEHSDVFDSVKRSIYILDSRCVILNEPRCIAQQFVD